MKDAFDIRFVQTETIPTDLRLSVNNKYAVYYKRASCEKPGEFAYQFDIYTDNDNVNYDDIVTAIVRKMESQSYDYGASWRETHRENLTTGTNPWSPIIIKVYFYLRDAG